MNCFWMANFRETQLIDNLPKQIYNVSVWKVWGWGWEGTEQFILAGPTET